MNKLTGQKININQIIKPGDKTPAAPKRTFGDVWSALNTSVAENNTLEDIQGQINSVKKQTLEYKDMLKPQYGQRLNLMG